VARPREHGEATRVALLEAAGRLLATGGPAAVTTRALAAETGTTTRAIYASFGSKGGLLRALHVEGFSGLARAMDAVPRTLDPLDELRQLGLAYRASARNRPDLYQVMFGPPIDGLAPTAREQALAASTLARLADTVGRCQRAGLVRGSDPWPVTLQLWALVHGLASLELRGALGPPEQAAARWADALAATGRGYAP
jgi:AcrR family transcriptional regulator